MYTDMYHLQTYIYTHTHNTHIYKHLQIQHAVYKIMYNIISISGFTDKIISLHNLDCMKDQSLPSQVQQT